MKEKKKLIQFYIYPFIYFSYLFIYIQSPNQELKKYNRYYYLQSLLLLFITLLPFNAPILVVWIRNLSVHWFVPFSSDHSVIAIAPIMIYVEMLTNQKTILPRLTLRIWHWITYTLIYIIVIYAFMYGIRYTHSLYFLSNGLIGWLLFLHFWHSPYGCHVYHYLMEHFYPFTKKKSQNNNTFSYIHIFIYFYTSFDLFTYLFIYLLLLFYFRNYHYY